ncbi:hypothetical protein C8Q74DRAFT_746354 [Fomes fomentarius]|nr:hypothetical protein C8Q74DRAFT_746354 [Fomes fomentarius]
MEPFPTELWNKIFKLACTDMGPTGASLSQTSRRIQQLSAPYRFHTVQLFTLNGVENFLACRATATERWNIEAPVLHLVLSLRLTFPAPAEYDPFQCSSTHDARDHARYTELMQRLFDSVASKLETMEVRPQLPEDACLPYIGRSYTFAKLRKLTLMHNGSMLVRQDVPPAMRSHFLFTSGCDCERAYVQGVMDSSSRTDSKSGDSSFSQFPVLETLDIIGHTWDEASKCVWNEALCASSVQTSLSVLGHTYEEDPAPDDACHCQTVLKVVPER